jgi:spermidine/putrescine transport system permease protein
MKALRGGIWLMAPSLAIFLVIFAAPLLYFFVVSFWMKDGIEMVPALAFANYVETFAEYGRPLLFTFGMAFLIGVITTVLAFCLAYVIRFKAGRFGLPLLFAVLLTLFGGYLTKVYVWKTILGQVGLLNSALLALGIIDEPVSLFLYNPVAVVITLTHYMLPLAILPIYGSLRSIDDAPLRGARDLGASPGRVLWDIVLPQCRGGILIAFSLTFLFAAGDWVTPKLVGGPHTSMIGTFIEYQYGSRFNQPLGSAMAFTVIAISVLVVAGMALLSRRLFRPR